LPGDPSQSAKPGKHAPIWHALARQLAAALANEQTVPQPPQAEGLFVTFVSQPLATLPSQLLKPAAQATPHVPVLHVGVPFVLEQTCPHAPQCEVLDDVSVSQPFRASPSQSPWPGSHAPSWQSPVSQLADAFSRVHATPHPLQSVTVLRLVSQPSFGLPLQSA
jgi:hypothetical protein